MLFHRPELIVYLLLWSVNQVQALIPPSKTTTPPGVLPASSASSSSSFPIIVKVCRNKTCQKRSPNLVQSLSNLLGKDCIEESGCLAQCDRGPNIQVSLEEHHGQHQHPSSIRPSNRQDSSSTVRNLPQILHEIHDVTTATIQLESIMTTLGSDMMTVSKLIKAAAKVLERASITSEALERERLTTSVIGKLVLEPHPQCTALAYAYALRAQAREELKNWVGAIEDVQQVLLDKGLHETATEKSVSICYRVWADSEEQLHHREKAIAVLQDWQLAQPSFRTKLQREVQDLLVKNSP